MRGALLFERLPGAFIPFRYLSASTGGPECQWVPSDSHAHDLWTQVMEFA